MKATRLRTDILYHIWKIDVIANSKKLKNFFLCINDDNDIMLSKNDGEQLGQFGTFLFGHFVE